jgi:hypothetical protein
MSNKQTRRTARAAATPPPVSATIALRSPRILVSGGMMTVASLVTAVSTLLPWWRMADGSNRSGVQLAPGVGAMVLGLAVAALGLFILLRPNHPNARLAAWAGLAGALGVGACGLITVATASGGGATVAPGVLLAIAGGMVASMGIRGLLEHR